ncbi:hypothetical protein QR680_009825 [Steinernema hermaphroditum]|uniref:Dendritic cell-specific transmembrane protein-like domain-containing protein n=1 Tax=Steinernema hermaphroditum TaxID=289476 RepID=A0AA39MAF5_9BILA|nr:hypothetical protein QR680_009825 [Steinernema hermaphroditum]
MSQGNRLFLERRSVLSEVFTSLFVEPYREERRKVLRRTRFEDIILYSGPYDYKNLRFLYNLPIGFGLCLGLYHLAWFRLNFAFFDEHFAVALKWVMISLCTLAFAFSAVFRCTLICVCLAAIGSNGQGLMSVFVLEQLTDGPINNTIENFRRSARIVVCHLEIQSELMEQRISLFGGNYTQAVQNKFSNAVSKGKNVVDLLKSSVDPFLKHFKDNDEEEKRLEKMLHNVEVMKERADLTAGLKSEGNETTNTEDLPFWTRFKSKMARTMARRLDQRCKEVAASSLKNCQESFKKLKAQCEQRMPFFVSLIVDMCSGLSPTIACDHESITGQVNVTCMKIFTNPERKNESFFTPEFDHEMESFGNVKNEIDEQFKLNLHYQIAEEPRFEKLRRVGDVHVNLQNKILELKLVLVVLKELMSALLIFFVYTIFRNCVVMLQNYLNNIDFSNTYLTKYFYYIDEKRKLMNKPSLLPFTKAEMKKHNLRSPFSLPTNAEVQASWFPFLKWFIMVITTVVVLVVDHVYYKVIHSIEKTANLTQTIEGERSFDVRVNGTGVVAGLLNDLMNMSSSAKFSGVQTNEHCLDENRVNKMDISVVVVRVILPLLAMFFLQVVFGFIVKRMTLFYVVDYIFRRRSKARSIQLYNKLLYSRSVARKAARARIRRAVRKHSLRLGSRTILDYFPGLKNIAEKIFKTEKCLMCLQPEKRMNLIECCKEKCTATYCKRCWLENDEVCYACQVEEGLVNDTKTQFLPTASLPNETNAKPTKEGESS